MYRIATRGRSYLQIFISVDTNQTNKRITIMQFYPEILSFNIGKIFKNLFFT